MKSVMYFSLAVMLAMILGTARAEESQPGNGQQGGGWHQFKNDMRDAGKNIGQTGKEIGLGVAKGAKEGSHAVKEYFAPDNGSGKKSGDSK